MWKKRLSKVFTISLAMILLPSCGSVTIPNTEVCTIKGKLSNGMMCAETQTQIKRDLTFEESLVFLEASEDENRGAALCQSSIHWNDIRISLEIACRMLGRKCKKKLKKSIIKLSKTIDFLNYVSKPP